MVSNGIRWYQMVSDGIFEVIFRASRKCLHWDVFSEGIVDLWGGSSIWLEHLPVTQLFNLTTPFHSPLGKST